MHAPSRTSLRLLLGALVAAVTLSVPDAWASNSKLHLVKRQWGTGEVRIVKDGGERLLDRYREPISVHDAEVSPDARWAFVWHYATRAPLVLSIYDLRSMKRTARFAPGYGGEMHFTPRGNIAHVWGCGSNCAVLALYDVFGTKRLEAGASGIEVSPTHKFAVAAPSFYGAEEPVIVYDLDTGQSVYVLRAPRGDSLVLEDVRWDDARGVIEMRVGHLHGQMQRVVVRTRLTPRASSSVSRRRCEHAGERLRV